MDEAFAIVALTKGDNFVGKRIFPQQLTLLNMDRTPMVEMEHYLAARRFNELVPASEFLSPEFREKYGKNLYQKIVEKTAAVRIFESKSIMNIASLPLPLTLETFFKELEQEMRTKKNWNEKLQYIG